VRLLVSHDSAHVTLSETHLRSLPSAWFADKPRAGGAKNDVQRCFANEDAHASAEVPRLLFRETEKIGQFLS